MTHHFPLISFLLALLAGGCASTRGTVSHESVAVRDSVVRVMSHTELVPVLVKFEVPQLREFRRGITDSTDVIENDFAKSTVTVNPDGTIDHGLETKPRAIEKELEVPVHHTDSSTFIRTADTSAETESVPVVTNMLKPWQKFLMNVGAAAIVALVIYILMIIFTGKTTVIRTVFKRLLNN